MTWISSSWSDVDTPPGGGGWLAKTFPIRDFCVFLIPISNFPRKWDAPQAEICCTLDTFIQRKSSSGKRKTRSILNKIFIFDLESPKNFRLRRAVVRLGFPLESIPTCLVPISDSPKFERNEGGYSPLPLVRDDLTTRGGGNILRNSVDPKTRTTEHFAIQK